MAAPTKRTTSKATKRCATLITAVSPAGSWKPAPQRGHALQAAPALFSTTKAPLSARTYVAPAAIATSGAAIRAGSARAVPIVLLRTAMYVSTPSNTSALARWIITTPPGRLNFTTRAPRAACKT